jgi:hypothetical protein
MDTSADHYKSDKNQTGPFPSILIRTVLGAFRWLAGIFTLTEADRLQAGIYFGGGEHDG